MWKGKLNHEWWKAQSKHNVDSSRTREVKRFEPIMELDDSFTFVLQDEDYIIEHDNAEDDYIIEHDNVEEKVIAHTIAKSSKVTVWSYDLPCDDKNNALEKALSYAKLLRVMSNK